MDINRTGCEHKPIDNNIKEALRTEYEKGRADAIAEMQNAWSKEDEAYRYWILGALKAGELKATPKRANHYKAAFNWLNSLKERYV